MNQKMTLLHLGDWFFPSLSLCGTLGLCRDDRTSTHLPSLGTLTAHTAGSDWLVSSLRYVSSSKIQFAFTFSPEASMIGHIVILMFLLCNLSQPFLE